MKTFKEIRQNVSENYYSGPTSYAHGGNLGQIAGLDLGGYHDGSRSYAGGPKAPFTVIESGLNNELQGAQPDVVGALTKAREALKVSGLSFEIDAAMIRDTLQEGGEVVLPLTMYGNELGAGKKGGHDKFAADLVTASTGIERYEDTLPAMKVRFTSQPAERGFVIKAQIME
jgi:hypothetical protein|tara:strand:+ start:57 stop:572 length:516 start_codon:yes stop_codon:yes gene_type:complete